MSPGQEAASLTPRQLEVAALVAEGLTNREIAERLFISERTAEGHVEQIRAKLGVTTRTQIVRWVTAGGLASGAIASSSDVQIVRPVHSSRNRRRVIAGVVVLAVVVVTVVVALTRGGGSGAGGPRINTLATKPGTIVRPVAVAVGLSGQVYVAERDRVVEVSSAGVVTPVAGGPEGGYGGDGGPAVDARLAGPHALAVDPNGDLYIADTGNSRVRRVDRTGTITTVAGTGVAGFSGDGGQATDAELDAPAGLAEGFGRSLYIADSANNRVRLLLADRTIVTVAGAGDPGYAGDGGPATSALFDSPQGLAFDHSGNLFVADSHNDRIRGIDLSGVVTTVAGDGQQGFEGDGGAGQLASLHLDAGPLNGAGQALAIDDAGRLYIADALNNRVRVRDLTSTLTTYAGDGRAGSSGDGGSGASAELDLPLSVAVGPDGRLYIADTVNNRLRVVG